MLKPICFMVMPYGRKATQVEARMGPSEIDFNALWDKAYVPLIQSLGYEAVRADQDVDVLIINQMLERLYFADLVLADMTIANGNVYYEVGIRHAAKKNGCVLLSASWARPLFDVAQNRSLRYPLPEGDILDETAAAIIAAIQPGIPKLAKGVAPMFQVLDGYPGRVDATKASTMKTYLRDLAQLQGAIRAIRAQPQSERMADARLLADQYITPATTLPVAIAVVRALREAVVETPDWNVVLDYIGKLPPEISDEAEFREQRAFALAKSGNAKAAIAELEALIEVFGPSPERLGLLGGRFKSRIDEMTTEVAIRSMRNNAITAYERGMNLDLNEYYCSSNLPRLYRARNEAGDARKAELVLSQVLMACERGLERGASDEWLRPTLLTAAFDAGDAEKAEMLADDVTKIGAVPYKLETIIDDLAASAKQVSDPALRTRFDAIVARLRASQEASAIPAKRATV